jgi:hypothetical protein
MPRDRGLRPPQLLDQIPLGAVSSGPEKTRDLQSAGVRKRLEDAGGTFEILRIGRHDELPVSEYLEEPDIMPRKKPPGLTSHRRLTFVIYFTSTKYKYPNMRQSYLSTHSSRGWPEGAEGVPKAG